MNENYTISHDLLQEVVTFLSKRPYVDVFQLVPKLMSLEKIPEPVPEPETPANA